MMMIYGMFVFMRTTAPYQSLEQNGEFRHVKNDRVNKSAKWQYIGAGENTITLTGLLYPEITGGDTSLTALWTMAYAGKAWPLIEGTGMIYGMYAVKSIRVNRTEFLPDGKAQKIEFTLSLQLQSEDIREKLASLTASDILSLL